MRKLLLIVSLLVMSNVGLAQVVAAVHGDCSQGNTNTLTQGLNSTTKMMASYPQCTVLVNTHGGGLATIYSDASLTPLSNPFTATTSGSFVFYAVVNARYDVVLSGGTGANNVGSVGFPAPYTISDITVPVSGSITGITLINTTTPLTGGPITSSGTIACPTCLTGVLITPNAVSDAVSDATCSMTSGSVNLTCSDAPFSTCPTGKTVSVNSAIAPGGNPYALQLITTINSCSSSSVAVLGASATVNTGANTTAIWGTNNYTAINTVLPSAAGKTLIFPPGNYLVQVDSTHFFAPTSNSAYWVQQGATIYMVGVSGAFGADHDKEMFIIPDDAHNILFQIDGIISGENTGAVYIGQNTSNQSAAIYAFGHFGHPVVDITVKGSGTFQNLYGFDMHVDGCSTRYNIVGLTHKNVAKGMNVNGNYSIQDSNHFVNSGALESAGCLIGYSQFTNNMFDNSGLQYVMSIGGETDVGAICKGNIVSGNTINTLPSFLSNGAIAIVDCMKDSVVANNTIAGVFGSLSGFVTTSAGANPTSNILFSNNSITCNGGLAGFFDGITSNNVYVGNKVSTDPSGTLCNYGLLINGTNAHSFANTYKGSSFDIGCNLGTGCLSVGDALDSTGTFQDNTLGGGNAFDPRSIMLLNSKGISIPAGAAYYTGHQHLGTYDLGNWLEPTPTQGWAPVFDGANYTQSSIVPTSAGIANITSSTSDNVGLMNLNGLNVVAPWLGTSGRILTTNATFPSPVTAVSGCTVQTAGTVGGTLVCAIYDSNGTPTFTLPSGRVVNPPGTLICANNTGITPVANTANFIPLSGCGTLLAQHLYYIAINSNFGTQTVYQGPPSFGPQPFSFNQPYFATNTCCTFPASLSGNGTIGPYYQWGAWLNVTTTLPNYSWAPAINPTSLTTTASASDNLTVTGMTSSGHCFLTATNATAATNVATTYVSAKTTNQITVSHAVTSGMTYDVLCTPF